MVSTWSWRLRQAMCLSTPEVDHLGRHVPELIKLIDTAVWTTDLEADIGSVAHVNPTSGGALIRFDLPVVLRDLPLDPIDVQLANMGTEYSS